MDPSKKQKTDLGIISMNLTHVCNESTHVILANLGMILINNFNIIDILKFSQLTL